MANGSSVATEGVEVLVIAGGQAGLAMGYHLAERGLAFVVADANPDLIQRIWDRKINPGKVFDLTLPLDQVAEGYKAMDERTAIKVMLTLRRPEVT